MHTQSPLQDYLVPAQLRSDAHLQHHVSKFLTITARHPADAMLTALQAPGVYNAFAAIPIPPETTQVAAATSDRWAA